VQYQRHLSTLDKSEAAKPVQSSKSQGRKIELFMCFAEVVAGNRYLKPDGIFLFI